MQQMCAWCKSPAIQCQPFFPGAGGLQGGSCLVSPPRLIITGAWAKWLAHSAKHAHTLRMHGARSSEEQLAQPQAWTLSSHDV